MRQAFEISETEQSGDQLKVAGRAYTTIKIGDVLLACAPANDTDDCAPFRVTGITMYGRGIEEIDAVFTDGLLWMEKK